MLTLRTQKKLATLIQNMAEGERKVESIRQVLSENHQFELYTTFKRLDRINKGYLTALDIEAFLIDNKIHLAKYDVMNIFKKYCKTSPNRILYNDFKNQILPFENARLVGLVVLRKSYSVLPNQFLPYEVEWSLARVFQQDAENARILENLREQVIQSFDYSSRAAFNTIDYGRIGSINFKSLDSFLQSQAVLLSDEEMLTFFRIVDNTGTQQINFSQFTSVVMNNDYYQPDVLVKTTYDEDVDQNLRQSMRNSMSRSTKRFYSPSRTVTTIPIISHSPVRYYSPSRYIIEERPSRQVRYMSPRSLKYNSPKSVRYESPRVTSPLRTSVVLSSPQKEIEEESFVMALFEFVQAQRDVEDAKNRLAYMQDFNLMDGFRLFDIRGNGFVDSNDFNYVLQQFGIFPTIDQVGLVYNRFDKDEDNFLRYSDFCKIYTPQSTQHANVVKARTPQYFQYYDDFSFETRSNLRRLFDLIINCENQVESIRQRLDRRPMFRVIDAFESVDQINKGYATVDEFRQLFLDYGNLIITNYNQYY